MKVTVDVAKQLWCPQARVLMANGQTVNRVSKEYLSFAPENSRDREYLERQEENCNCLGDDCMMWRWLHNEFDRIGYCGLGGKP